MIIDWTNMGVTGISGIRIEMPNEAKISIFTDNDLNHITDDHFEIKLVARLLDQIYVVPSPQSPPRYDDTLQDPMTFTQTVNSTGRPTASAPMLLLCCSNVVQVPLSLNPFQLNLEFGTTHRVQMCYTSKQV